MSEFAHKHLGRQRQISEPPDLGSSFPDSERATQKEILFLSSVFLDSFYLGKIGN